MAKKKTTGEKSALGSHKRKMDLFVPPRDEKKTKRVSKRERRPYANHPSGEEDRGNMWGKQALTLGGGSQQRQFFSIKNEKIGMLRSGRRLSEGCRLKKKEPT